jgi:hypothetical protein
MFQIALIEKRSEWKDVLTIGMHCVVSTASAPIRSELNGPVTGHAAKGEWYYLDHWPISNKDKSGATLIEVKRPLGARLENAGLIKVADLDCEHWERSDGFPVLFDDPRRLRPLGVDFWFTHKSSGSPYQMCFHNGSVQDENGLPKLYLSKEFRRHHRDYNFHKLCLVMRSGVIRFDPESGQRLPSFIMINREYLAKGDGYEGLAISDEIPLVAPPCLNKGDFDQATSFAAKLSLSGCSMRYHPWSGRELNEEERKLWRTAFISVTSESAPDPSPEAVRVVKERPSSASEAEIARLTRALKAR